MCETVLMFFIVVPSLIIVIAYALKGWFIENYDPYAQLSDINCFDSLRNNSGNGFKRFLAAVKYERLRRKLLVICMCYQETRKIELIKCLCASKIRKNLVASLKLCMTHLPGLSGSFRLVQSTLSRTS